MNLRNKLSYNLMNSPWNIGVVIPVMTAQTYNKRGVFL